MSDSAARVYDSLFGDDEVNAHLSSRATVQSMLDVERALAEAQADAGVIPAGAVASIAGAARADLYDLAALAADAAREGNLAIPLVRALGRRVAALTAGAEAWVHFGATSQDVIDTGLVLQLRASVQATNRHLDGAAGAARNLARAHARTVMPGRTWLRQGTPTTFGLVAAGWADAIARAASGLNAAMDEAAVVQFGGATGTLAAIAPHGPRVAEGLASRLGLRVPDVPWHAHRERLVGVACAKGIVCGVLGKVALDVALLGQTETGEVEVGAAGTSSTMPHKRNPVGCAVALAAARRAPGLVSTMLAAMTQELQRGLGGWHAEWETLCELTRITAGSARAVEQTLASLDVRTDRMRANLDLASGEAMSEALVFGLAGRLGRDRARTLVAAALARAHAADRSLLDALGQEPEVSAVAGRHELERMLDPTGYTGAAEAFVARVLARLEPPGE